MTTTTTPATTTTTTIKQQQPNNNNNLINVDASTPVKDHICVASVRNHLIKRVI